MGGGHDHHGHGMKIPDYKIYKVEAVPELMATQRALSARGLKDPWLRNEVWKYRPGQRPTHFQTLKSIIGRGFLVGLVAGAATSALEKWWLSRLPGHHGHHGEGHGH